MTNHEFHHSQLTTQAASLSSLLFWYPFFAKSLYQRTQILASKSPGDLSHSPFFSKRRNYYRGITANLSMQPLFPITDWMLENLLKKLKEANQREPNHTERLCAGFVTGATTVLLANPYEVTVIASQTYDEAPYLARKRVWKMSGVRGFYVGALPMAVRNGTLVSSLFVATPLLEERIGREFAGSGKIHDCTAALIASLLPAVLYTSAAVPLDFMAVMRQSDPTGKVYASAFQALKAAYQKHGVTAFKAGLGCRLAACIVEITGFQIFKDFYSIKDKDTQNT